MPVEKVIGLAGVGQPMPDRPRLAEKKSFAYRDGPVPEGRQAQRDWP